MAKDLRITEYNVLFEDNIECFCGNITAEQRDAIWYRYCIAG